jgi:selenocysteine lyase/cysteine desulfurase
MVAHLLYCSICGILVFTRSLQESPSLSCIIAGVNLELQIAGQDLPSQRALFDIPDDVAYFNTAYNSPLLNASRERLLEGAASKSHPWERTAASFFEDADTVRRLASDVLGGDADGYAIVPAASYGCSAAARAVEPTLGRGDKIVVMDEEFPSNYLPWERSARERGAGIVTVPTPADGDWTKPFLAQIEPGVKVVAAGHCHWTNGAFVDLVALGKACRAVGASLALDLTQSLGAMPFDFTAVQPDFVYAAGYKWLLCPYGFGLMYVAPAWRDARPLEESWLKRENAENFAGLVKYASNYAPGARRFDVGETVVPTVLPGAIAALEQLKAWQVPVIAASLARINARIAGALERHGFALPPQPRSPHMFGARLPEGYQGNLVAELAKRRIYISQRGNAVRFAPHLYVSEADLARLETALNEILG